MMLLGKARRVGNNASKSAKNTPGHHKHTFRGSGSYKDRNGSRFQPNESVDGGA